MPRALLTAVLVPIYTLVFGVPAFLTALLFPRVDTVRTFGRLWARMILLTSGVRVSISGLENVDPERTYIYLSNHQSNLDVLAILVSIPTTFRIIAKRQLFYIPVFGWCLWAMRMIAIDRSNHARAVESLERAIDRIRQGTPVFFFCEGTRSHDGVLLPFKKGAFVIATRAGVPVIPVTVAGTARLQPKGSGLVRSGTITIDYGRPISTEAYTVETKERLMSVVRAAMLDRLGQEESHPDAPGAAPRPDRAVPSPPRAS